MGTIIFWIIAIGCGVWWLCNFLIRESRQAKARAEYDRQQAIETRRAAKELEELRKTATSSTGGIRGHRIARQIKMIAVDNYHHQDDAERDFFRQVQRCGGNGVINMKIRRQKGAFISIQGDAVVLE